MIKIHSVTPNRRIRLLWGEIMNRASIRENQKNYLERFIMYKNYLTNLAITSFAWDNLPPTIDPLFIETQLFFTGKLLYFRDEYVGDLVTLFSGASPLNVYNQPILRYAYANNGYYNTLDERDSVIIYNNPLYTGDALTITSYALKLATLDQIITVNAQAQRTPYILMADTADRLSIENFFSQMNDGANVIFPKKTFDMDNVRVLNLNAPYVADKIQLLKTLYMNEILTYLGIDSNTAYKNAQQISVEINADLGITHASVNNRLITRQHAVQRINRMFDTNITVRHTSFSYNEQLEVTGIGNIHNDVV